ncbi:MAG: hypothetical protein MJB57_12115, partial [Gemmatimonadetes bacterium]|nr:hypothetical protein [Gemmatimonadota bacterium]
LLATERVEASASFSLGLEFVGSGSVLLGALAGNGMPPDPERDGKFWLLRIGIDGVVLDTLITAAGPGQLVERTAETMVVASEPFQRKAAWAVGPSGQIAFGTGESYDIALYEYDVGPPVRGADARMTGRLTRDVENRRATRSDQQRYTDRLLESAGDFEMVLRAYRKLLDELEFPDTWPAFRQIRFDDRGRLWVESEWPSAQATHSVWDVFDSAGTFVNSLTVAGDVDVSVIRGSYLYGIEEDSLGVQYVKRWRFDMP